MQIDKILWQNSREFIALYVCQHCGSKQESGPYQNFYWDGLDGGPHSKDIAAMECRNCEKTTSSDTLKENDMQDHAYEIRQQYIKDYAARVKLAPEDQRALWVAHLREIKHPRIEPLTRREPVPSLAEAVARLEQERKSREVWKEI